MWKRKQFCKNSENDTEDVQWRINRIRERKKIAHMLIKQKRSRGVGIHEFPPSSKSDWVRNISQDSKVTYMSTIRLLQLATMVKYPYRSHLNGNTIRMMEIKAFKNPDTHQWNHNITEQTTESTNRSNNLIYPIPSKHLLSCWSTLSLFLGTCSS